MMNGQRQRFDRMSFSQGSSWSAERVQFCLSEWLPNASWWQPLSAIADGYKPDGAHFALQLHL